ncbi:MmgE/PrpD family protein [Saccharopolyspora sp. TS4A08]|uniref:MmgE/PrpD family protein n=1 Tax=Saccharopolyspora ipomoeae TaxID=3042027 RepID=A0ABT6PWT1_9PSEU|nr:MmgE/PrpD family protein [Saccharopolyspora sp. TS4A08]MDI2032478.1 MmgE/PrpD family protein [Saccharopolyspora sp. TS4A08]
MSSVEELTSGVRAAIEQACALAREPLSDDVRRHAAHVVADAVGVSIAGGRTAEMTRLRGADDELGGPPPAGGSTVLAAGAELASAEHAAFHNATAGSFLELDEGTRPTGHPGMHLVPAALAVAEATHRSGAALLGAVVAGYEVSSRLLAVFRLRPPTHPHGHLAGMGGAVAVALLLDEDPLAAAAIAATTPVVPVWNACYVGATARNTAMGLAAQTAVRSIRLLRAGFTGSIESIPALFGGLTGQPVDDAALREPVEHARPRILRNYFKRHSACALTHGAIDAVLSLPAVPVADIESVEIHTVGNNLKLDRQPAPNDLSARFSLPYAVAAALTHRASTVETFDYDPDVAGLAAKVAVSAKPEFDRRWPDHAPTEVVVRTSAGTLSAVVDDPRGHHHDPLSSDELRAKFVGLVGGAQVDETALWQRILALPDVDDCSEVLRPLRAVSPV